jgi:hypothetical protein
MDASEVFAASVGYVSWPADWQRILALACDNWSVHGVI